MPAHSSQTPKERHLKLADHFKFMGCICTDCSGAKSPGPRPHYPSMPRYPKGTSPEAARKAKGSEVKALFSVAGMTCAACAGSVEKAVKRLPGIHEAAVDVLNNTALVLYYPSFVNVSELSSSFSSNFLSEFFSVFFFFTSIKFVFFFHSTERPANAAN